MKLYDYYRSTASYRIRIALNLKNIHYEKVPIHLVQNGGEQHQPSYLALNPQGLVPTLEENGHLLTQSLAILEYLEEIVPSPPLLPSTPLGRSQVRSFALMIACEIHPLNNLRVLEQLKTQFNADSTDIENWYHHWLRLGFDAFEKKLQSLPLRGKTCYGQELSLADVCLIPQVYNAKRFNFSLEPYPIIQEINNYCLSLSAFKTASPEYSEETSLQ